LELFELETLGDRVRKLRIGKKLTQRKLAEKIGVSHSTVSKIESNHKENVDKEVLIRIADLFEVSIDYLFGKSKNLEIQDANAEFATRFKLDLSDEDLLKKFDINFNGRDLNEVESKTALAVLRAFFDSKKS
jgi:transcriptional regulator with XRE-family HTH domain